MSNLAGCWAGKIYGTNTGNIFVELSQNDSQLSGSLRINDDRYGITIFAFSGTENGEIVLNCTPQNVPEGVEIGPATVKGKLQSNGSILGQWETTIGNAGTFRLWPHNIEGATGEVVEPEQVYNRNIKIGSVRIFKDEIKKLFRIVQRDFVQGKMIVTYQHEGNEIVKYADTFLEHIDTLKELKTLKLFIQEPEVAGINRSVSVDLLESGESAIRVTGVNESWVVGKAENLRKSISAYENQLVTNWKKYGLNLNFIIFLLMIVFAPEISPWPSRLFFVVSIFMLLLILYSIHSKLIPNTYILLEEKRFETWERAWPSILSFVIAVSSSVLALFLFNYFSN